MGARNSIAYCPHIYALTTIWRGTPTVSASGAIIGIDSTAKPEEDGTIKPRKKNTTSCAIINRAGGIPVTKWVEKSKMVSEIKPSSSTMFTPRAKPIISDTPTNSDAPLVNEFTISCSLNPDKIITKNAMVKNEAAICGNHQPRDITPHTKIGNAATNSTKITFLRQSNATSPSAFTSCIYNL